MKYFLVFLPLLLIQEGQLPVTGERMSTNVGGLRLPRTSVVRLTDRPDMTIVVYCFLFVDVKQQHNNEASQRAYDVKNDVVLTSIRRDHVTSTLI